MVDIRLVAKETMLGLIRELEPPQEHIGQSLLPLQEVQSDDVIWDSVKGLTAGLANARAEDSEAEIASKDEIVGTGRAAIIDWALKDRWTASDVTRYREVTEFAGQSALPRTVTSIAADFQAKMARAAAKRRRALDNRLEWLIWQAIEGSIAYDDGKIKFSVDYGVPSDHKSVTVSHNWDDFADADPIGNMIAFREKVRNESGVELKRVVTSRKVLFNAMNCAKFSQLFVGQNPFYMLTNNFGIEMATEKLAQATDMTWTVYDSRYRTRDFASTTITNNRFSDEKKVYLFPAEGDIVNYSGSNTGFGVGNLLTSPHPEGNWAPGYYEWEQDRKDPWGTDQGTGIKAFPVIWTPEVLFNATVLS